MRIKHQINLINILISKNLAKHIFFVLWLVNCILFNQPAGDGSGGL